MRGFDKETNAGQAVERKAGPAICFRRGELLLSSVQMQESALLYGLWL